MSASPAAATTAGGVFVVTYVIPQTQTAASHRRPEDAPFTEGRPEVIGGIQIFFGFGVLVFGMLTFPFEERDMRIFIWETVFLVAGGSLMVAARKSRNHSLVKLALGFNVVAAGISAGCTIIYLVDTFLRLTDKDRGPCWSHYYFFEFWVSCGWNSLVLLALSTLGLILSTSLSVFGTKALHQCTDQQPILMINQPPQPASPTAEPPSPYEPPPESQAPPPSDNTYERVKPPEYDTNIIV